jgi:hypothetical protein
MKIVKSLHIEITQEDVEKAIIQLINQEDPTIVVDSINFKAKRNGDEDISVSVDAHFDDAGSQLKLDLPEPEDIHVTDEEIMEEFDDLTQDAPVVSSSIFKS